MHLVFTLYIYMWDDWVDIALHTIDVVKNIIGRLGEKCVCITFAYIIKVTV